MQDRRPQGVRPAVAFTLPYARGRAPDKGHATGCGTRATTHSFREEISRPIANRMHHRVAAVLAAVLLCACAQPDDVLPATARPGDPLPGLDSAWLARFEEGRTLFHHEFTEAEGLGPLFNQRRCSSCHDIPTLGGNGAERVTKVSRFEPPDRCDLLEDAGGDMLQAHVTTPLAALGVRREPTPDAATAVVDFHAPPLYATGLIEAVPDDVILRAEDPDDADGDGISGRAVRLPDGRLGRFGRTLQFATAREFIEDALLQELGLTSPAFPHESTLGGKPLPDGVDPAPDPEVDDATIDLLADFVRLLAAPEPAAPPSAQAADTIASGRLLFGRIGCADCHTPELTTGGSNLPALNGRRVALYSDLLLHDLGDGLASVCAPGVAPSEWRTAPLLGLRWRTSLLHDGRAHSFRDAIMAHGGEAAGTRTRFLALTPAQQTMLLRFLGSI